VEHTPRCGRGSREGETTGAGPDWPALTPAEAIAQQRELAARVVRSTRTRTIRYVAGADAAFMEERGLALASVVVLRFPELEPVESAAGAARLDFPYMPGLLSFREVPALLAAFAKLRTAPDAVLCDGHGLAHPRRFGLASHLGVALDVPTIGCAKTRLYGVASEPALAAGSTAPLVDPRDASLLGAVVRTRTNVRPVYVSIGHLVDLRFAVRIVLCCARRFRLPEPLRLAHQAVSALRRAAERGELP
jgi:deoxyribonuclease V